MTTVGFVGLGAMGRPMARHLAARGFAVVGYDPFAPEDLEDGFDRAPDAAAAAQGADVVVLMVATPEQAMGALEGEAGILAGLRRDAVVVVTATVGPDAIARLADAVRGRGGHLVDAPVSGGVARAGTGDLLIMVGAEDEAAEKADAVLQELGGAVFRVGDRVGDGQRMKLVNQLLCGVHIAVAGEALAFARSMGIDPAAALEVLSSGAAASFMLSDRGPRMVAEDFETPKSAVDIFVKDLGLVTSASAAELPIAHAAHERFVLASHSGKGRLDDSAVITTFVSTTQGAA